MTEALARIDLPGPTGESNRLTLLARAPFLCLGPGTEAVEAQADAIQALGGHAIAVKGRLDPAALAGLKGFAGVLYWGTDGDARAYGEALAARSGPILPLITTRPDLGHVALERHVCVDTTASGGNAQLLAEAGAA